MLQNFLKLFSSSKGSKGGGKLAPLEEPKVTNKQVSLPSHMTSAQVGKAAIPKTDLNLANKDLVASYRFGASTSDTIRILSRGHPDLSAAVSAHLRIGIPEKYIIPCYNPDGSFNVDATRLVHEIFGRFDTAPGWDTGFSNVGSIRSIAEAVGKEIIIEGAGALELVLNKARQPASLAPVSVKPLKFYDDHTQGTKTIRPVQVIGGEEIDLDIPNFFMVWLDASLIDVYPQSPMEAAVQPVLAAQQFIDDLRRLCERHVYPRYVVTLNYEEMYKSIPEETKADSKALAAWCNNLMSEIQENVNTLGPTEALVIYDYIEVKYIEGQDGDLPATFEVLNATWNGKVATGAKSMGSVLGHGGETQNIASTETMLEMLQANGMVRIKLQELFSKAATMMCRLFGMDVRAQFEYDDIDLRPALELEAFKAQKQSRIKEQLSMGMISDEEAILRLTGRLDTTNMQTLSGTMFMDPAKVADDGGNGYSGTGVGGGQSGGGAATQSRKPKTVAKQRGQK